MSHLLRCSIQNIPVLNQTKLIFSPSCFCIADLIPRYRRSAEIRHHLKGLELAGEILAVELTGGISFKVILHGSNMGMHCVFLYWAENKLCILKQNSVVLPAQNVLLILLLGFTFQAFFFTWHLYFNYSCCLVPLCLPFVVWAVPFFPSEIPLLPHWSSLWCGTCFAGDHD